MAWGRLKARLCVCCIQSGHAGSCFPGLENNMEFSREMQAIPGSTVRLLSARGSAPYGVALAQLMGPCRGQLEEELFCKTAP